MKRSSVLLAALPAALFATAPKQPNIILFLVDDMGWQDTSHPFWNDTTHFNRMYHTPAMERLAAKGVTFTNAYASAVSSPTRTSLMTGMNPAAHRVTNWTIFRNKSTDTRKGITVKLPDWNYNGLQPVGADINNSIEATTFPELLRQNGYTTLHCGKAHWGVKDTPGADPLNLGFDVNIAGYEGGAPASYLASENFGFDENGLSNNKFAVPGLEKYWGKDLFLTEILTIEAKDAMNQAVKAHKPFYLYMSHYAIHTPHDKDDRYYQKYIDAGMDDLQARYSALIEGMDKSLGDLMNYLDSAGIADNTVILFMSDNGGVSHNNRSGELNKHNYPLSNGKGSAYEGGVRVPMIAYWPGVTPMAARCSTSVDIADFYPSILELAGVKPPRSIQQIDGISFVPLLKKPAVKNKSFDRPLIFHFPNRWADYANPKGHGYGIYSSIIQDGYKLIYYYDYDFVELYNIVDDIGERRDLAADKQYASIKRKLEKALTDRLRRWEAQRPSHLDGSICNYPDGTK